MSSFRQFINDHGASLQLIIFILFFIFFWNIEDLFGSLFNYKKWKHATVNASLSLMNIPGQLMLGLVFAKTTVWTGSHQFGLLRFLPFTFHSFYSFLVAFVFLDLGEYVYHVIMHKVKRLWMFHIVHHSDHIVDVSTTFREHPGENIIRLSFTLVWVFLCGCPLWMLIIRQVIQAVTTLFAHVNYRLPDNIDRLIGFVFITPSLHQVHHHYKQPYTDCNYGDVLSIWDRLFGTFRRLPPDELCFGVDSFLEEGRADSVQVLAKLPFGKYRKVKY